MLLQDETQRWDKHVVPGMECLRTAVQFRPPPPFSEKAGPERVRLFCLVERPRRAPAGIRQDGHASFDYQFALMGFSSAQQRVCGRWYVGRTLKDGYDVDELGAYVAPCRVLKRVPLVVEDGIELGGRAPCLAPSAHQGKLHSFICRTTGTFTSPACTTAEIIRISVSKSMIF